MLEKVINEVCYEMSEILTETQIQALRNILYMNFHDKRIVSETTSIIPSQMDPDMMKLKMFVASKRISGRSETTLAQYVAQIMSLKYSLNKPFAEMTSMDIRWYFAMCQVERGNSMNTLQNRRRALNSFFNFMVNEEMISKNPLNKIEPFKVPKEIKKPFSAKEMESLRMACKTTRDRALIEFLYSTGLRVSELCTLNVGDIDLYKQEFTVRGKGNKERMVYISDVAYFHLQKYIFERCGNELCTIVALKDRPLFETYDNPKKRLTVSGVQYNLRTLGKRANVENVHPHRFRRTFATDLLARGMRIEEVMILMGHVKIETTMIYCTVNQSSVKNSYFRCA